MALIRERQHIFPRRKGDNRDMLLNSYQQRLRDFCMIQARLMGALDHTVHVVPAEALGYQFQPSHSSFLKQLQDWPRDIYPLPPGAWIEPRTGIIDWNDETWSYAFHGLGLSFTNRVTNQDISVEFTAGGQAGITQWTIQIFLETLEQEASVKKILDTHDYLFEQAIRVGLLVPVPPWLSGCEQTYLFVSRPSTFTNET